MVGDRDISDLSLVLVTYTRGMTQKPRAAPNPALVYKKVGENLYRHTPSGITMLCSKEAASNFGEA